MKRIVFLGVLSCFGVCMLAANTAFAADLNSSRAGMCCYKTCLTCYLSYLTPQDLVQSVIVFLCQFTLVVYIFTLSRFKTKALLFKKIS